MHVIENQICISICLIYCQILEKEINICMWITLFSTCTENNLTPCLILPANTNVVSCKSTIRCPFVLQNRSLMSQKCALKFLEWYGVED